MGEKEGENGHAASHAKENGEGKEKEEKEKAEEGGEGEGGEEGEGEEEEEGEEETLTDKKVKMYKKDMRLTSDFREFTSLGQVATAAFRNPFSRELLFYVVFVAVYTFGAPPRGGQGRGGARAHEQKRA